MSTNFAAITTLLRAGQQLGSEAVFFHDAAAKKLGLHVTDVKALNLLLEYGPLTAGDLAKRLKITPGATTSLVRRLQKARFIRRKLVPSDRRIVIIQINPQQIAQATVLYQPMINRMTALLEKYSIKEIELLTAYEQSVAAILREEALRLLV